MTLHNPADNTTIEETVDVSEEHIHNRERWFGIAAVPTATNWGTAATLTPYRAISGNGDFGTDDDDEALILGSADTPAIVGMLSFDLHRIMVVNQNSVTAYVMRMIWGTGTMAAAELAGQYSDIMMITDISKLNMAGGGPVPIMMFRIASGTKVWARVKNATDDAWLDFFIGLHEYDEGA